MEKNLILDALKFGPRKTNELTSKLKVDQTELVGFLLELEKEEKVMKTRTGSWTLKRETREGTIIVTVSGIGFIKDLHNEDDEECFVPAKFVRDAWNGDTVKYIVTRDAIEGKNKEARVISIIERSKTKMFGYIVRNGDYLDFQSDDERQNEKFLFYIKNRRKFSLREGDRVSASLVDHSFGKVYIKIEALLGSNSEPASDVPYVIEKFEIKKDFDRDTLNQTNDIPEKVEDLEWSMRTDLTKELIVTIDGADSKDLDDAVSLKKLANGNFELAVHIADVSHYVLPNTPLDNEAFERGTSVYLVNQVVPMLPERLSNNICSLNPHTTKLTLSCFMEIDNEGNTLNYRFENTIIETTFRLTYDEVNDFINNGTKAENRTDEMYAMLTEGLKLSKLLEARKIKTGMINFDVKETKVILDDRSKAIGIKLRTSDVAEKMIEHFMVAANEATAKVLHDADLPNLYRIHPTPSLEKVNYFFDDTRWFGLEYGGLTRSSFTNFEIQKFVSRLEDSPLSDIIKSLLLKSMEKAIYSPDNIGHFGLGLEFYSHFTSPIRRYPDLVAHRLIKQYVIRGQKPNLEELDFMVHRAAEQATLKERTAVDAERDIQAIKKAEYASGLIDVVADGQITTIKNFGMFITLVDENIEGLVSAKFSKSLSSCVLNQDKKIFECPDGIEYKIGDRLKVAVVKVNRNLGKVDLEIIV